MVQPVWNGFLRLSLVSCPVSLVPVAAAGPALLTRLNARTGNPVRQQFVDAKTGDVVADDAIATGYQVDGDRHVRLSDDELATVRASTSRIVDVDHFVPADQVDRLYVDTAFYLYPDGQLAADTVHALRLAMTRNHRVGLGRIQLADDERLVLLEPHGAGLLLATLHSAEAMQPADFPDRGDDEVPAEMVDIAETIIGRRAAVFDRSSLRDRFREGVRKLLADKAAQAPAADPPPAATQPEAAPPPNPEPLPSAPPPAEPPEAEPNQAEPHQTELHGAEPSNPEPHSAEPQPPSPGLVERAAAAVEHAVPAALAETDLAAAPAAEHDAAAHHEPAPEPHGSHEPHPTETAGEVDGAVAAGDDHDDAPHTPEAAALSALAEGRDLGAEILLHIVGLGDRRYVEPGWAGNPGSHRQIEALSIRPGEGMSPNAVEFKVFAQEGRATSWVSDGNYAGTRGRGLPLTGFAIRPAQDQADRIEIVYEGCFFEGGVVGPKRDGELCISAIANDPLEAVRVSIVERGSTI